jgi:hypothetical protein
MTSPSPRSPKLLKASIVLVDAATRAARQTIVLQYNPDTLTRSLQIRGASENSDRSEALRLTGPPVETIQLEAEIDATDQLEDPRNNKSTVQSGIHPQLAALEALVFPTIRQLETVRSLARSGSMQLLAEESPLALFVWSAHRVVPVRVTEFRVTEEAFDPSLNPLRARVSIGLRVLNENDLGFDHHGSEVFRAYHRRKEQLAGSVKHAGQNILDINTL